MRRTLVVALALAGCKGHQAPPPPPPPDPGAVQVVLPGLEPRHVVRYALAKGTRTTLDLTMDTELHADQMGGAIPTLELALELDVEDVTPDGAMHVRTTVVDATAHDRPDAKVSAAVLSEPLSELRGLAVLGTLSPDGKLADVRVDTAGKQLPNAVAQQLDSLSHTMQQLAMPLPREPVGTGARWVSTRQLDVSGVTLTATSTVDLVALSDHALGFMLKTELTGPDQQIQKSGLAIDVTNAKGTGSGAGTIDLATLAMTSMLAQQMHADYTAAGVHTATDLKMSLVTRPK